MYRGFEINNIKESSFGESFQHYLDVGEKNLKLRNEFVKSFLSEFKNSDKSLNGNKMQSNWFPQIEADIFLSHSHADKNLVIAFAGWLNEEFSLDVFIDSCVWKYSMDLQEIIDNYYSINNGKLIYDKILYASSHVHMMLNTALMQMIDNCECVMFINTPNSVKPDEVVTEVVSPWIYSELGMTKLIKKKDIKEHRPFSLFEESENFSEQLSIRYNLDTEHLTQLSVDDLKSWKSKIPKYKTLVSKLDREALDILYKMKSIRIA